MVIFSDIHHLPPPYTRRRSLRTEVSCKITNQNTVRHFVLYIFRTFLILNPNNRQLSQILIITFRTGNALQMYIRNEIKIKQLVNIKQRVQWYEHIIMSSYFEQHCKTQCTHASVRGRILFVYRFLCRVLSLNSRMTKHN